MKRSSSCRLVMLLKQSSSQPGTSQRQTQQVPVHRSVISTAASGAQDAALRTIVRSDERRHPLRLAIIRAEAVPMLAVVRSAGERISPQMRSTCYMADATVNCRRTTGCNHDAQLDAHCRTGAVRAAEHCPRSGAVAGCASCSKCAQERYWRREERARLKVEVARGEGVWRAASHARWHHRASAWQQGVSLCSRLFVLLQAHAGSKVRQSFGVAPPRRTWLLLLHATFTHRCHH